MPTYQYICKSCNYELEELQSMSEPPLVKCPNCGQDTLARIMSSGSGLIFKGSGFYKTDYAKKEEKPTPTASKKPEEKKAADTPATSTSEPKPASPGSSDKKD